MKVAVSGAGGRMGHLVAETVHQHRDHQLAALFDPNGGVPVGGIDVSDDPAVVAATDVVVEFTVPDVVMANLATWNELGVHAVVGTSGFDAVRIEELRDMWGSGPPNVLVAPNFSIGAVMLMRLSELAAPHFRAAEVIELHHDRKADAPSGTAIATAEKIGAAMDQSRAADSDELVAGARGAEVSTVPVHAVRLPGLVAHQEVIFGGEGQVLSIRHDTTDRASFMPGVVLAVESVAGLQDPVTVGLEPLLGI